MIRFKMNVMDALKESGYTYQYFKDTHLLSGSTMVKLNHNKANVTMKNLNLLCYLLQLDSISDLVEFIFIDDEFNNIQYKLESAKEIKQDRRLRDYESKEIEKDIRKEKKKKKIKKKDYAHAYIEWFVNTL